MEKMRILVIDDEEAIGKLVKLNLEETGEYTVQNLTSGLHAVIAAVEFKPDFIFLDLIMPDIDGGSVYNSLKENEETKDIPVVFLTALTTDEEVGESGEIIGGHPILAKPVTTKKLIECIKKYGK
ncbi:MAG: response regulator [Candidatus Omnitrophica bacterium]|nr:response regulator [Candidatus Omnitrophota bacterium]